MSSSSPPDEWPFFSADFVVLDGAGRPKKGDFIAVDVNTRAGFGVFRAEGGGPLGVVVGVVCGVVCGVVWEVVACGVACGVVCGVAWEMESGEGWDGVGGISLPNDDRGSTMPVCGWPCEVVERGAAGTVMGVMGGGARMVVGGSAICTCFVEILLLLALALLLLLVLLVVVVVVVVVVAVVLVLAVLACENGCVKALYASLSLLCVLFFAISLPLSLSLSLSLSLPLSLPLSLSLSLSPEEEDDD